MVLYWITLGAISATLIVCTIITIATRGQHPRWFLTLILGRTALRRFEERRRH